MQLHTISTSLRNTGYHGDAAEAAGCREKERERRERERTTIPEMSCGRRGAVAAAPNLSHVL